MSKLALYVKKPDGARTVLATSRFTPGDQESMEKAREHLVRQRSGWQTNGPEYYRSASYEIDYA